jgi:methanogenic corrinoid protein MtbC1
MREMEKIKKDDPDLAAGLASFAQNYKIIKQVNDRLAAKGYKSSK